MSLIVWSRPSRSQPFCAVARTDRGSVVTYCEGRWEPTDRDEIRWRAPKGQGCGRCTLAVAMVRLETPAADAKEQP